MLHQSYHSYETIAYDATLHVEDPAGTLSVFQRTQLIRFLDNGFSYFVDRVWGDGVTVANYAVRGLRFLDGFPSRGKRLLWLELPRRFQRGETFEIQTSRRIIGASFGEPGSYWDSAMFAPTDRMSINVIPPRGFAINHAEIDAPTVRNLDVQDRRSGLRLQVRDPNLYIPYKLIWSMKRKTGPE